MKALVLSLSIALTSSAVLAAPANPSEVRRPIGRATAPTGGAVRMGPAHPERRLERLVLALAPRALQDLARLLRDQQDPASPQFHRWLTPAEFGRRFGPTEADVTALKEWLAGQGLEVETTEGRMALLVSGSAADVERAFRTRVSEWAVEGEVRLGADEPPSLPVQAGRAVAGLASLGSLSRRTPLVRALSEPLYNTGFAHRLAPADFHRIYHAESLLQVGIDGTGTSIGVIARTNVKLADTLFFRDFFGLKANDPVVLVNGTDPGVVSSFIDQLEANLDIQWAGGVAPGAAIKHVVSKSTPEADGIDLSVIYAVDKNVADVLTLSYGECEQELIEEEPAAMALYVNAWAQAAAQGQSVFVASGDTGAAGCTGTHTLGVNALSTSPYATCVGGTQYDFGGDESAYWDVEHDPLSKRSARSYIPETVWNSFTLGTGGGISTVFDRPAWQTGPGVPEGSRRVVPDVAVAAAGSTGYMVVVNHSDSSTGLTSVQGTSASAPALAGLAALLVQKTGGRIGNANPVLYALGRSQYAQGGPKVFNDVTTGDNSYGTSVPGYRAGVGFDLSTGWGSPDAAALAAAWPAAAGTSPDFSLGAWPAVLTLQPGGNATVTLTLAAPSGSEVTATVLPESLPAGVSATFSPAGIAAKAGAGVVSPGIPGKLTLSASTAAPAGSYTIVLGATAGGRVRTLRLRVGIAPSAPPSSNGVEEQVPVVLDLFGAGGSHYTSDLTAVNRSAASVTLLLKYVPQPGTPGDGGPVIARSLPAGTDLHVPDVIAFLRENGYKLPADTSGKIGTLFVTFDAAADPRLVFAGSRTTTPNPNKSIGGAFGTFASATPSGGASQDEAWIYGLRETADYRSNLAVVHSPATRSDAAGESIQVQVQVFDGDRGQAAGEAVTLTLRPGELQQLNSVLAALASGVSNGYARVRRVNGSQRFIAYGVVNDGNLRPGTNDGSFLASAGTSLEGLIPIGLDLPGGTHFQSELVLVNPTLEPALVLLRYTPSTAFPEAAGGGIVSVTLERGRQLVETNALAFLRRLGLKIPEGSQQGGTLLVTGAVAQARTFSPNPDTTVGGTYGLSYPSVASAQRAKAKAVVYGLRQDADVRSNLAIADARYGDPVSLDYEIEIYDSTAEKGLPSAVLRRSLTGGQWVQLNSVLGEAGLTRGYAIVKAPAAGSDFVAYGVVNDGSGPGIRTSDGSYIPMVVE